MSWLRFIIGSMIAVALAAVFAVQLGSWQVAQLQARVDELQREKARLASFAERLSGTRRVAQLDVLTQSREEDGQTRTRVRWQQIGEDGIRGEPHELDVVGDQVYVEAMVLKFDFRLVAGADDTRKPEVSLAMFRRIFGNGQSPESGARIDRSEPPPASQPEKDGSAANREMLWKKFWALAEDPREAAKYGVRVAQCEAPSTKMRPGEIWEVSLDHAGGVNLRKLR